MPVIEHSAPERVFVVMLRDGRTDKATPAEGAHQFRSQVEYVRADLHRGAVAAVDDAFQVILDALASLHPEPAKRLMETSSYKAFAAYVKQGQSETPAASDEEGRTDVV